MPRTPGLPSMLPLRAVLDRPLALLLGIGLLLAAVGCRTEASPNGTAASKPANGELTVYSGRAEALIGPAIENFRRATGIDVNVRYGDTSELAGLLHEEGRHSPADVYIAQDAGALGAVGDLLSPLPSAVLDQVDPRFRGRDGTWVGISGRARVVAYNTQRLQAADLPQSIDGFTGPKWKGRIGWAPKNGSFQAFVTALRVTEGEDAARRWLEGVQANQPKTYPNNTTIVQAVALGEIEVGFVNHYYLLKARQEQGDSLPVENHYLRKGDAGALINVAGAGILKTARNRSQAEELLAFLLSNETQQYFAAETFEYPLAQGVTLSDRLVPLAEIATPDLDLSDLSDLRKTVALLRDTGVLR